jgi:hypothetical protein
MPSPGTQQRIRRIKARATPAIRDVFEAGQISARRADIFLHMPHAEAEARLAALLAARDTKAHAYQKAASVIEDYLREQRSRIDLHELGTQIRSALGAQNPQKKLG